MTIVPPQVKSLEMSFLALKLGGLGTRQVPCTSWGRRRGGDPHVNTPHFLALVLLAALDLANSPGVLCNSAVIWL